MILDHRESIYLEMDLLDMDHAAFVINCASHSFQDVHLFASTVWSDAFAKYYGLLRLVYCCPVDKKKTCRLDSSTGVRQGTSDMESSQYIIHLLYLNDTLT